MVTAEIIETLRAARIAPTASVPRGDAVHDLAAIRPAAIDCGWQPGITLQAEGVEVLGRHALAGTGASTVSPLVSFPDPNPRS